MCLIAVEIIIGGYTKPGNQSADFRAFYAAGYTARTHPSRLYDMRVQEQLQDTLVGPHPGVLPFNHLPYEALVYAPFSLLPYQAAYASFAAFNMLLLLGAFFAARSAFSNVVPIWGPRPGLILLVFFPVLATILEGQDSILLLLLWSLTWRELSHERDISAGLVLALALFKFQLALPMAVLLVLRRGHRLLLGFLAGAAGVLLASLALVGSKGFASLYGLLAKATVTGAGTAVGQSAIGIFPGSMANLRGLVSVVGGRQLSPAITFGIVALLSMLVFLYCIFVVGREQSESVWFALSTFCVALVSFHLYLHDATLLLLPIALLAGRWNRVLGLFISLLFVVPPMLFARAGNLTGLLAIPMLAIVLILSAQTMRSSRRSAPQPA